MVQGVAGVSSERGGGRRSALGTLGALLRGRARAPAVATEAGPGPHDLAPVARPLHCDWAWRPPAWSGPVGSADLRGPEPGARLCPDLALFHDCPQRGLDLRQVPPPGPARPFGIEIAVRGFGGSFLSLALDLPAAALAGLGPDHVVTATAAFAADVPVGAQARLNLRQGPEHHRLPRAVATGEVVEFDLGGGPVDGRRIEAAWLDLIFVTPPENRIRIADLTLARRPRAAF